MLSAVGQPGLTSVTTVKVADSPLAIDGFVHCTRPGLPTSGVEQSQPAGALSDVNVTAFGRKSLMVTVGADGPAFVTVIV